jgi:hypothetical protein
VDAAAPNRGISLTFKGPEYPDPLTNDPIPQSFDINIYCDTEKGEPTLKSYDGKQASVEWRAPAGCNFGGTEPDQPPESNPDTGNGGGSGGGEPSRSMGSGLGYFFLLCVLRFCCVFHVLKRFIRLLLAFVAYFGLGAYYNYSTYGATGIDLIPCVCFMYISRMFVTHTPIDIETSGEKCLTCCGMLFHIYARQFDHARQVEAVILLSSFLSDFQIFYLHSRTMHSAMDIATISVTLIAPVPDLNTDCQCHVCWQRFMTFAK